MLALETGVGSSMSFRTKHSKKASQRPRRGFTEVVDFKNFSPSAIIASRICFCSSFERGVYPTPIFFEERPPAAFFFGCGFSINAVFPLCSPLCSQESDRGESGLPVSSSLGYVRSATKSPYFYEVYRGRWSHRCPTGACGGSVFYQWRI